MLCTATSRSGWLIPLSVSPNTNSDESRKQSLHPDGDLDHRQNLIICSLAHYQHSLQISYESVPKFLRKVANRQTDDDENIASLMEVINKVIHLYSDSL